MKTFEGHRIYSLDAMIPGNLYMYYHDEIAKDGVVFYYAEMVKADDAVLYVGENVETGVPVGFHSEIEQINLNAELSALYSLSEIKNAN